MKTLRRLTFLVLLALLPVTAWARPHSDSSAASGTEVAVPVATTAPAAKKIYGDSRDKVDVTLEVGPTKVHAGQHFPIAVIFNHESGWHTHTNHPIVPPELGDASFYIKTQIVAGEPTPGVDLAIDKIQWPPAREILVAFGNSPVKYGVFTDRAIAYVPATVLIGTAPGTYPIDLRVTFQTCDEHSCLRPTIKMKLSGQIQVVANDEATEPAEDLRQMPDFKAYDPGAAWPRKGRDPDATEASATAPTSESSNQASPAQESATTQPDSAVAFKFFGTDFSIDPRSSVGYILLLSIATLGGFLLNLTPCVLPVIPIKIMSLSKSAGNRSRTLALGAAMGAGVVGFWIVLGLLVSTVGFFKSTNQLFQYPAFTIGVGAVIGIMGVGMCGLFSFQLPNWVYTLEFKQDSYPGSVGYGVMTAVLSTPCTAPLMGAAAAWAATQSPAVTLTTFAFIGLGMASPYLILAAFPQLVSRMPRTGPASELIKQVMGLLMLAAAAYFAGTGISGLITREGDAPMTAYWWVVALCVCLAGAWLAYRTLQITKSPARRALFAGLGVLAIVASVVAARHLTAPGPTQWVYFTPQKLEALERDQRIIVMDFTAEWCINCKVLEATVLNDPRVVLAMQQSGVTAMKVDLTNSEDANRQLAKVGRLTIPLLVIFDATGREVFKSDAYTPEQVIDAIAKAKQAGRTITP